MRTTRLKSVAAALLLGLLMCTAAGMLTVNAASVKNGWSGSSYYRNGKKVTGLVPIDDMTTMYTADEAANFWDVFGRNTDYVIDPEEVMADNFSYAMIYGPDGKDYETPEIIQAIDKLLKAGFAAGEAA